MLEDEDEVDKTAAGLVGDFDNARSFPFDADDVDDENALDVLDVEEVEEKEEEEEDAAFSSFTLANVSVTSRIYFS